MHTNQIGPITKCTIIQAMEVEEHSRANLVEMVEKKVLQHINQEEKSIVDATKNARKDYHHRSKSKGFRLSADSTTEPTELKRELILVFDSYAILHSSILVLMLYRIFNYIHVRADETQDNGAAFYARKR